jgi:hypothetical protein
MDLFLTNLIYVSYRLIISGSIVKFLNKYFSFFLAVLIMAQLSFSYDTFVFGYYFNTIKIPLLIEYIKSNIIYTIRVLCAWWIIKQIWKLIKNYWIAVFIGAEITFMFDFFIFKNLFG